ncbi:MAG: MBL fold metallo-hydrolase [Acidimicrobiia bacterium]
MDGWLEVGDGVYCRRYDPWDVSVGVVVGRSGVVVIDTRATVEEGLRLVDDVRALDRRPPRWVVNTHRHFDHLAGNPAFVPPAEACGHPTLDPPPALPVPDRTTLDLGDRTVELRHLGRGHTDGDLVVVATEAGVVFAGDLVEESGPPAFGDDSHPLDWPTTAARLLGLLQPGDRVVPGHGAVVDRAFVAAQQRDLAAVARAIRHLWVGEVALEEALAAYGERWPWSGEVLREAVARGYAELDRLAER